MGADRTVDIWGRRTPHPAGTDWPVRVDEFLVDGLAAADVDKWVRGACLLCSNGCGIEVAVRNGQMVGVRGRAEDRVNRGRLGPKGMYGWQGQLRDRLTAPLIREGGRLVETDWDTAMSRVVQRSRDLLDAKGPLSHGFFTSGQLMIEEFYTLAVIGKGGIGTPHMDGNTRWCTSTAAAAFGETFGSDGQPGSYTDIDHCDAIFLFGHNVAETQSVLWARMLDRLDGPNPPLLVCVDPRRTKVAERATVHLPVLNGTNLALMNALVHEQFARGYVDRDYVDAHTVGVERLAEITAEATPEWAAGVCDIDPDDIRRAAEIFGTSERIVSTCSMGFYQSHQATAAACQVNNLHLLRGMIGRPGAGILQMNGQPSAQNNRETGCGPALPGFRNWANPQHVDELARLWNVDPVVIPHWAPPTHGMQLFRYAEEGSIGFLWISGTNPAVSMPDLERVRRILSGGQCFVVVSDAYRTETTELADVVLPAALWGEKTGTFTNVDRTVHLQEKAVEPPGAARSDLDIFLDYARRMGFVDRDGRPLPAWNSPEDVFEAWKAASAGRPCDYSGMSYATLHEVGGIQWPCTSDAPHGTERLYADGTFPTDAEGCETFGHDLSTGVPVDDQAYRALRPAGRAILKAVPYEPPFEEPDVQYPFRLTTGRTVYHWHTRTKTRRSPQLNAAAPAMWVEISASDAGALGIAEGDIVRIASRRGSILAPARIAHVRKGVIFAPWHYGDDIAGGEPDDDRRTAANDLTLGAWDPVSKQPEFKVAAVSIRRVAAGSGPAPAPTATASAPVRALGDAPADDAPTGDAPADDAHGGRE